MINIYMQKNINKNDFKYSKNIIKMNLYHNINSYDDKTKKIEINKYNNAYYLQ